jgi:hypothetical protein
MKRRTVTVGQMMGALVPIALVLWLARPAVTILVAGVGAHSHPPDVPARVIPTRVIGWPEAYPCAQLRLASRGYIVHPNPFWPQYLRLLAGRPWPGDWICPLVPEGTPPWRGEMISADMY